MAGDVGMSQSRDSHFEAYASRVSDPADSLATLPTTHTPSPQLAQAALDDVLTGCAVAVLIPCYNEAVTIGAVVSDFKRVLPKAHIYVYDNNSTDGTAQVARSAGAIVRTETRQGKGHVVRRMFRDVDADLYLLVDGDNTYDAGAAPLLITEALAGPFDLVNAVRIEDATDNTYRPGHRLGNQLLTGMVMRLFGNRTADMLSGYKALSRRFVKSFPVLSSGFEIETELTVHALELEMPIRDVPTLYGSRPTGSASKLNTFRDGWRILLMIVDLCKQERPLLFFSIVSAVLAAISVILSVPIFFEYFQTHTVPRFPTVIASSAVMLLAFLAFTCGLILDTVSRGRVEAKSLHYLNLPHIDRTYIARAWLQTFAADQVAQPTAGMAGADMKRKRTARVIARRLTTLLLLVALCTAVLIALSATGVFHISFPMWPFGK